MKGKAKPYDAHDDERRSKSEYDDQLYDRLEGPEYIGASVRSNDRWAYHELAILRIQSPFLECLGASLQHKLLQTSSVFPPSRRQIGISPIRVLD